jgi:hypothetical protein
MQVFENIGRGMRLGLFTLLGAILAACGETASTSNSPSANPAGNNTTSSVPAGLSKCPTSGDVTTITEKNTAGEWQYQSAHGAQSGDIEVYADTTANCMGMPSVSPGSAKIIASAVITFKDAASANAAYSGMFGVNSTSAGAKPGALKGSASGYGTTSVYAYSSGESLAIWVSGNKVIAVIGENLSATDFSNYAQSLK